MTNLLHCNQTPKETRGTKFNKNDWNKLNKYERYQAGTIMLAVAITEQPVLGAMLAGMYPTMDLENPGAQAMFN